MYCGALKPVKNNAEWGKVQSVVAETAPKNGERPHARIPSRNFVQTGLSQTYESVSLAKSALPEFSLVRGSGTGH